MRRSTPPTESIVAGLSSFTWSGSRPESSAERVGEQNL